MTKVLAALTFIVALTLPLFAEALPASCLPTPLPAIPIAPTFAINLLLFDSNTLATIWRQPCADGSGEVAVLLRLTPVTAVPTQVCSTRATIFQAGIQRNGRLSTSTSGSPLLCGPLSVPVTAVLLSEAGEPDYDETAAFRLIYAGTPVTFVDIPAGSSLPVALAGAAILPGSRAVQVGHTATAFATLLAIGGGIAIDCTIAPINAPEGTAFSYQQTNAANVPIGEPNTPVTIPGGGGQSFVISLTPFAVFPATEIDFAFACANTPPVPVLSGVNTFLLTSTSSPGPDIVALAATVANDGIVNIPGPNGIGFFAVATSNIGTGAPITATMDTGNAVLPVSLSLCQTDPTTGLCIGSGTVQINAGQTPTFAIFVTGAGVVPFDPGLNRIFVRFRTGDGAIVGATSVAVRTQ
jgi:hypothetical protein